MPISTAWSLPVKKVRIQSHCMLLIPMSLSFTMRARSCGTVVDIQPHCIYDILSLNANFKGCRESGRVEEMNSLTIHS